MCVLYLYNTVVLTGITISFKQSMYIVGEGSKTVTPVLLLSKSSTTEVTVHVQSYTIAGE